MKKVFALIAIVGFVACNNAETDAAKAIADSTTKANAEKVTADSIAALAPNAMDTAKAAIDTAKDEYDAAGPSKH